MKQVMKHIIAMAAALIMLLSVTPSVVASTDIWDGSIAEGFRSGNGSAAEPYIIADASELAYLAKSVSEGDCDYYDGIYIQLSSNIYLNDTTAWNEWQNGIVPSNIWAPIGSNEAPFCGSFNGNGYSISGIYVDEGDNAEQLKPLGLFGCVRAGDNGAVIEGVNIVESYLNGYSQIGGVVGAVDYAIVRNCTNAGTVCGRNNVGGVVGHINGTGELDIYECYNSGAIIGRNNFIGGVVGGTYYTTVALCGNSGAVVGNDYVGGVVGGNDWNGLVEKSYNTGAVTGNTSVGGVAGYNNGWVFDCYNTALITAADEVGGVTGSNLESKVQRCYNRGEVVCPDGWDYGGVIGIDYDDCDFSSGYYLDTCCDQDNGYGAALASDEFLDAARYDGFDFELVWTIDAEGEYPYAQLKENPHMQGGGTPPVVIGDANGNGVVESGDALMVLRCALGLESSEDSILEVCDIDGNGELTSYDAIAILRIALNINAD